MAHRSKRTARSTLMRVRPRGWHRCQRRGGDVAGIFRRRLTFRRGPEHDGRHHQDEYDERSEEQMDQDAPRGIARLSSKRPYAGKRIASHAQPSSYVVRRSGMDRIERQHKKRCHEACDRKCHGQHQGLHSTGFKLTRRRGKCHHGGCFSYPKSAAAR